MLGGVDAFVLSCSHSVSRQQESESILTSTDLGALLFGRHKNGFMMVLRAYFDASCKESDPVMTVGGYLAASSVCDAIERDWEIATGRKVFHLTDFGTPACELGSNNWNGAQRVAFLKKLAAIMHRPDCYLLSISVETAKYSEFLSLTEHPHVYGPAYSGCAQACVALAETLLDRSGARKESKLAYIFEKGDREEELARSLNEYDKRQPEVRSRRSHAFLPKRTTLLQPADLICGKIQEALSRAYGALGFIDNGLKLSVLHSFEHYYNGDGTTHALVYGHDSRGCLIANKSSFIDSSVSVGQFFEAHPEVLRERLKKTANQGKRKTLRR